MAERRWYRLHGITWIGLCIVCAALTEAVNSAREVGTVYGWPLPYKSFPEAWWYCPLRDCPWWNCRALNLAIQVAAIAAVAFVLEKRLRSKNRLQVTLLGALILISVLSVVFALAQFEPPMFPDCELDPTASAMPWPVRAPILFALACTIYTAGWLVARLARSLYSLAFRRPR
jgi:hypothetical protein